LRRDGASPNGCRAQGTRKGPLTSVKASFHMYASVDPGLVVLNPHTGASTRHVHNLEAAWSLCRLNDEMVLTVSNGNAVAVLGLDGGSVFPLVELDLSGPGSVLCPAGDGTYFLFSATDATTTTRGIILRLELLVDPLTLHEATITVSQHFRVPPRGIVELVYPEDHWVIPNSLVIDPVDTPVRNYGGGPHSIRLRSSLGIVPEDRYANWIEFDATIKCYPGLV
jgi:hypothetical protein